MLSLISIFSIIAGISPAAAAECLSDTCILWQVKPRETH
jgi:hypothetical protein